MKQVALAENIIGTSKGLIRGSRFQVDGNVFQYGPLVELVKTLACHAGNHGFESHTDRHT